MHRRVVTLASGPQPRRGGLFIERRVTRPILFVFRRRGVSNSSMRELELDHGISLGHLISEAAPPKDKKKHFLVCGCYKQATPTGFANATTTPRVGESGSIMMITVIAACLLGITLGSYLLMVRAESVSVARSQAWNAALAVAGAGVEEALAALNQNAAGQLSNWGPPDISTSGWPHSPIGYGPISRALTSGSITNGTYSVFITTNLPSIIYSTGYVTVPALSARISRVIRVITTTNVPLFTVAAAAKTNIILAYNLNNLSDSFDSAVAPYSTQTNKSNGGLACMSGTVDLGYRRAFGDVLLGPTAQLADNESQYVVGKMRNDFNAEFPDITLPSKAGWMSNMPSYTNSGVVYKYACPVSCGSSQNYDVTGGLNGSLYVAPTVDARLAISGNVTISNLYIAGGGKLTVFMSGANFTLTGKMTVESGYSTNFCYLGLPGNTTFRLPPHSSGTNISNFFGTVYAPGANLSGDGDYSNDYRLIGSFVAGSINLVGWFSFHYDENLLRVGPRRGYLVSSWQEL